MLTNGFQARLPDDIEPKKIDIGHWGPNELETCHSSGVKVSAIKLQKHYWIRRKPGITSGTATWYDYFVSVKKNEKIVPYQYVLSMKGYKEGTCVLDFKPERADLAKSCGFEINLLTACFMNQRPGFDPTGPKNPLDYPPFREWTWANENTVGQLAKRHCKSLVRLYWNKAHHPSFERLFVDLVYAMQAALAGSRSLGNPGFDIVLLESSDSSRNMMIMNLEIFAQLFPYEPPILPNPSFPHSRVQAIKELFMNLFKEKYGPDLFFCNCRPNCNTLLSKGNKDFEKQIIKVIHET